MNGINHNGNIQLVKQLIDMAVDCGCDAVKFQKRDIDAVYTKEFLDSHRDSPWGKTQREQKGGLELKQYQYDIINDYCRGKGILWFASAWDLQSQEFLRQYNMPYNKIASAMITNKEFVEAVAEEGKHTLISTGMCEWSDIDLAVNIFDAHNTPYTLLHCVSTYPCEDHDCNLNMIKTLKQRYDCSVGYSGHERGITPSLLAVAMGAEVIERHITKDRTMYGSDQSASLEKRGLEILVREARQIHVMMGTGIKEISDKEAEVAKKLRYWEQEDLCPKG